MDGTLLNSNHEVSAHFFELFKKLKAKNILFVAASGRQYHSMRDKLDPIKDDIIFISENGALVKQRKKELSVTPIGQNLKTEVVQLVDEIDGTHTMLCGKYTSYFEEKSRAFLEQLKEYYSNYNIVDDFDKVTDEIVKIAVYHPKSAENFLFPKLEHLENKVKVKVSGLHWLDLNHIEAHKGNALKKVMQHYSLSPEEILAFGDYNNDLEMLQLAGYSFAMANAHPNIKKVAKFETASNDAFGVETILEKLV